MLGFPGSAASAPLLQFLGETRELLQNMIRVVNMRDTVLVTLSVVSDMAYAWLAISDYSPLMRMRIQRNPFSVLKLRATFLKLVRREAQTPPSLHLPEGCLHHTQAVPTALTRASANAAGVAIGLALM